MFRGSGAADGNRLTTYIVLSGSGLSSSAPMTLESGVLSNSPPSQYGTGRPPAAGGDVLRRHLHLQAVEAIQLARHQIRGGEDQARRALGGRAREVFRSQLREVHVLRQRRAQRAGLVEAGPVRRIQVIDA